jgi:hypothetical protein
LDSPDAVWSSKEFLFFLASTEPTLDAIEESSLVGFIGLVGFVVVAVGVVGLVMVMGVVASVAYVVMVAGAGYRRQNGRSINSFQASQVFYDT